MSFHANNYGGHHKIIVKDEEVIVKVSGSKGYKDGEYMNERNVTIDVRLEPEQVLEAAKEIENND